MSMTPQEWMYLGTGRAAEGVVTGSGFVPARFLPAWISLHVQGTWRGFRVQGFVFPQRAGL